MPGVVRAGVNVHCASVCLNNARKHVQQGGFPGAGGSHNGDGFAGVDVEGYPAQYSVGAVGFNEATCRDDGPGRWRRVRTRQVHTVPLLGGRHVRGGCPGVWGGIGVGRPRMRLRVCCGVLFGGRLRRCAWDRGVCGFRGLRRS